jgi:hypothetical protein
MNALSLDYAGLMSSFRPPLDLALVSDTALLTEFADWYEARHGDCALHQFEPSGASYLFDLASSANLPQEDRTVAALALTPQAVPRTDIGEVIDVHWDERDRARSAACPDGPCAKSSWCLLRRTAPDDWRPALDAG